MTQTLRRAASLAAPLAALALVVGCAGAPTVQPSHIYAGYTPDILNYAAARGGMLTQVIGNPFAGPKGELDSAVVETAAKSHFGQKIPFFTQAPDNYTSPYRVVFAMNPVRGAGDYGLCAGQTETRARAPSESDRVEAALCAREVPITSAKGSVAGPLGARDPAFLKLIAQLSQALFPPVSSERRGGPDASDFF